MRLFHVPNHMASILLVLICRPLTFLNSSKSFNNLGTKSQSRTRTVVSSAYCVIFISFWPTIIPLIFGSFFDALAKRFDSDNKKEARQGTTLPDSSLKKKEFGCMAVVQDATGYLVVNYLKPI